VNAAELRLVIEQLQWGSCDGCGSHRYCPLCGSRSDSPGDTPGGGGGHYVDCPAGQALGRATIERLELRPVEGPAASYGDMMKVLKDAYGADQLERSVYGHGALLFGALPPLGVKR
jgi:hypothetical protein